MRALLLLASLLAGAAAHGGSTFIPGPINCANCGNPNTDWQRYRNAAFNACRWLRNDTACSAVSFERFAARSDDRFHVNVCSTIESIINQHECQVVEFWWTAEPGITRVFASVQNTSP